MQIIKSTVEKIEDFQKDDMKDAIKLMGFDYLEMNFYRRVDLDGDLVFYVEFYDDAIILTVYENGQEVNRQDFTIPIKFIDYVEGILNSHRIAFCEQVGSDELDLSTNGIQASTVLARQSTRQNRHDTSRRGDQTTKDLVSKMNHVKSSNVWSYAFQPKDHKIGNMLMQFKNKFGGPGDIYIYYGVPTKVWQRLVAAPSKGHFMWEYIRNVFTYAKLTGDKKTKLPNGI